MNITETLKMVDNAIDAVDGKPFNERAEELLDEIVNYDLGPCTDVYNGEPCPFLLQDNISRTCECNLYSTGGKAWECPRTFKDLKAEGFYG